MAEKSILISRPSEIALFSCLSPGGLVFYNIYEKEKSFSPNVSVDRDDYMGKNKDRTMFSFHFSL